MVAEEAERVVGPSRSSADDLVTGRDTMALLGSLEWAPPLPMPFDCRFLPGAIAKLICKTYDRGTSATRLQSCFCWRWRVVSSRRPKENCLCNRKVPQLQQSSYQHEPKDVPTIWTWHTETAATIWTWHTETAAEKTHPSTFLPLGTTGQDETALQDDRPAARGTERAWPACSHCKYLKLTGTRRKARARETWKLAVRTERPVPAPLSNLHFRTLSQKKRRYVRC